MGWALCKQCQFSLLICSIFTTMKRLDKGCRKHIISHVIKGYCDSKNIVLIMSNHVVFIYFQVCTSNILKNAVLREHYVCY